MSGAAMEAKTAEDFGQAGEVGVQLARRETGLRPLRLAVAGIEQGDGKFFGGGPILSENKFAGLQQGVHANSRNDSGG